MYLVKKFCDMVGVSYSTLRHYERIGLLDPAKDEENNYRKYRPEDAFKVNNFRYYRSLGYDSKTALMLTKEPKQDYVSQMLNQRKDELVEELLRVRNCIDAIINQKELIQRLQSDSAYWIGKREDMLFLSVSEGIDFEKAEFEHMSAWAEHLPVTRYAKIVHETTHYGMSIDSQYAYLLKDKEKSHSEFIPGGICLFHYSTNILPPFDYCSIMSEMEEYMVLHHMIADGILYIEGAKVIDREQRRGQIVSIPVKIIEST